MARRFFIFRFLLLIAAVLALALPGSAFAPWARHVTGDASQDKFPLLLRPDADVDGDGVSNWESLFGSAVAGSQENTVRYTQWVCSYISELVRRLGMTDPAGGYVSDASANNLTVILSRPLIINFADSRYA